MGLLVNYKCGMLVYECDKFGEKVIEIYPHRDRGTAFEHLEHLKKLGFTDAWAFWCDESVFSDEYIETHSLEE